MGEETAIVYNSKGKKICVIKAPQGWTNRIGIPLFPLPITVHQKNVWENEDEIIKWAWYQAVHFVLWCMNLKINDLVECAERTVKFNCFMCDYDTIVPNVIFTIYGKRYNGIACSNEKCPMFRVVIPWQMIINLNVENIPTKYRPQL